MKGKNSKFALLVAVVFVTGLVCSLPAFAVVVKHEKIVAADGSGDYTTITAALNSITGASDTNRYLITVRPGVYSNEPNGTVIMKSFVDVRGSGQENTKITSGAVGPASNCAGKGTVVMDSNTRLENIAVENTNAADCRIAINIPDKTNVIIDRVSAQTSGNFGQISGDQAAIYIPYSSLGQTGTVTIKNSMALVSGSGSTGEAWGLLLFPGSTAHATIYVDNVIAECNASNNGYCGGLAAWRVESVSISNSSFKAAGGAWAHGMASTSPNVKISNVNSTANSGTNENFGFKNYDGSVFIDRSRFTATGLSSHGIDSRGLTEINNSEISGDSFGINKDSGSIKIGSSLISTSPTGTLYNGLVSGTDKIVNCHDGNYNPIPNF